MRTQLIKSTVFFQQLLSSRFRTLKERCGQFHNVAFIVSSI